MSLAIFIPRSMGVRSDLDRVGLSDLAVDKGPSVQASTRPSGPGVPVEEADGSIFAWGQPQASDWRWTKHSQVGFDLPFYIGLPSQPVNPKNLERRKLLQSYPLELLGQVWHIPVASSLPALNRVDHGSGEFIRDALPWHKDFQEKARDVANTIFQALGQSDILAEWREDVYEDREITVTVRDMFDFAVHALSLNYRVNSHIVDRLGLVQEDRDLFAVAKAVIEFPLIDAARHGVLKKKDLSPRASMPV